MEDTDKQNQRIWGRKQKVNLITQFFLLAGFGLAVWLKCDFQLFLVYAAGVTGANGFFTWGNSQEYRYGTKPTTPTA